VPDRDRPAPLTLTDADVIALGEQRAIVFDDVLGSEHADEIQSDALELFASGALRPAGIGRTAALMPEVRSDHIRWLDPGAPGPFAEVLALFESLRRQLGELAYLGARTIEAQLAVYPPSLGYTRHRDTLENSSARRMTLIYYANECEGGELELYEPDAMRLIAPIRDRLILFRPELEHAVRPIVRGQRIAISGWLRA
jgi:SM-20-related protein